MASWLPSTIRGLLAASSTLLLSGCYAGVAGIVAGILALSGSDGGNANEPPRVVEVETHRLTGDLVRVRYVLIDDASGLADVDIGWRPAGSSDPFSPLREFLDPVPCPDAGVLGEYACRPGVPIASGGTTGIPTVRGRRDAVFLWSARSDLMDRMGSGSGQVELRISAAEPGRTAADALTEEAPAGNESPAVLCADLSAFQRGCQDAAEPCLCVAGESGFIPIDFRIADSSGDPVTLEAQFRLDPDSPFLPMTIRNLVPFGEPNPTPFRTSLEGESHTILWDSAADLPAAASTLVSIRLIPHDVFDPNATVPVEAGDFTVDNNADPVVEVKEPFAYPERSFEIPVRIVLRDGDLLQEDGTLVILQWAPGSDFPDLGELPISSLDDPTPADRRIIQEILEAREPSDPHAILRRKLHILTEAPLAVGGLIDLSGEVPAGRVRIPDLVRRGLVFRPPSEAGPSPLPMPPFTAGGAGADVFPVGRTLRLFHEATGLDVTARITSFDPRTSLAGVEADAGKPLPESWPPGTRYELRPSSGLVGLSRSAAGLVHTFIWDSFNDLLGSGHDVSASVGIRAVAIDSQRGEFAVTTTFAAAKSTLEESQAIGQGVAYEAVATGDLNGDGRKDIAAGISRSRSVDLFLLQGPPAPGFPQSPNHSLPVAGEPAAVGLDDVLEDAGSELLVGLIRPPAEGNALILFPDPLVSSDAVELPLGSGRPVSVAAGDFDGTGGRDVAAAVVLRSAEDRVLVFLQHQGAFGPAPASLPVPDQVRAVIAGDIDRDGRVDLLAASWDLGPPRKGAVRLLFQDSPAPGGEPRFTPLDLDCSEPDCLDSPVSLALEDLTADGFPEIAVVNKFADSARVFRQVSPRVFVPLASLPTGGGPLGILMADLGSGPELDLLVLSGGSLELYLQGKEGLPGMASVVIPLEGSPPAMASGDFNLDGREDLVVAGGLGKGLSVFSQTYPGFIGGMHGQALSTSLGEGPVDLEVGDVTGDGRNDLVALGESGHVVIFPQDHFGNLPSSPTASFSTRTANCDRAGGALCRGLAIGDFDADGRNDVVVTGESSAFLLHQEQKGVLSEAREIPLGLSLSDVALGDVDGDGRIDMVVADGGSDTIGILRWTPRDGLLPPRVLPAGGLKPIGLDLGDLDGDGKADIVVVNESSGRIGTCGAAQGSEKGSVGVFLEGDLGAPAVLEAGPPNGALAIGDVDGDGRNDLVLLDTDHDCEIFLRKEDGSLPVCANRVLQASSPNQAVAIGDVNGDERIDVVLGPRLLAGIELFFQDPLGGGMGVLQEGSLRKNSVLEATEPVSDLAVGDLNGDGRNDLVAAVRETDSILIFRGR